MIVFTATTVVTTIVTAVVPPNRHELSIVYHYIPKPTPRNLKHIAPQPHFHAYDFTRLGIHAVLRSGNSSAVAGLSPTHVRSSMMPVFTIFPPGKKSPLRHSVVPQSPQKCDVMTPPESPVLVNSLGVPRDVSVETRRGNREQERGRG